MRIPSPSSLLAALLLAVVLVPALAFAETAIRSDPKDETDAKTAQKKGLPDTARKPATPLDLLKKDQKKEVDELILRGASPIPISSIIEETIDELLLDLGKLNEDLVSPIAVRAVTISPNLKSWFAQDLESKVVAGIAQATKIKQIHCAACRALKSRVEGGEWVVTLGPVDQKDLARLGQSLGVASFLELDFSYWSGTNSVAMQARLVRASDSVILWSEAYTSDATTAALLRGRERAKTRDERRDELQRLIEARPYYGQGLFFGVAFMPWDNPMKPTLSGATGGYRLYEKFGADKRSLFGLHLEGFINLGAPLFGAFVGASFLKEISVKSLHLPELRVGGTLGGFLVGTEGNSFFAEGGAEMMMKFRFGLGASVFYMLPTPYLSYDLGGLGGRVRLIYNW